MNEKEEAMGGRKMSRVWIRLVPLALLMLPAVSGCGSKTFKNITKPHITRSQDSSPLRRKYDRLTKGMTGAEVVALMGVPTVEKADTREGFRFTVYTYEEGDWRAIVVVNDNDGLVVAHSSDDPDFGK